MNYLDFDLIIEPSDSGYRARVFNSPAGEAEREFALPFSDLEIENFVLRLSQSHRGVRRLETAALASIKTFGGQLFDALFDGEMKACFLGSVQEAGRSGAGLRVRLRLSQAPELVDLPWEFLYDSTRNRFLSLSMDTPLVRYLDLPDPVTPMAITLPLRVLVVIASPSDYPALDVEQEWRNLQSALAPLDRQGSLRLDRLEEPTLSAIQQALRRTDYHIFHFVGHGGFDEQSQDGLLILEDGSGNGSPVSGQYLGMLLHDAKTLRLALLNACEGGRTSRVDLFAGVCQTLLQQGVPAVIAMQFSITDQAAITLSQEFYRGLTDGLPVDAALAEARKGIFAQGNEVEWATPALYLRAPDARLFDLPQNEPTQDPGSAMLASSAPIPSSQPDGAHRSNLWRSAALLLVIAAFAGALLLFRSQRNADTPGLAADPVTTAAIVPTDLPTPSPTLSVAALPAVTGELVVAYTFDDPESSGWNVAPPNWQFIQAENRTVLQGAAPDDQWIGASPIDVGPYYGLRDYALNARIRVIDGGNAEAGNLDMQISVRTNDHDTSESGCESYAALLGSGSQAMLIRRLPLTDACAMKTLADRPLALTQDVWHEVRLAAVGSLIRFYLDDQLIAEAQDDELTRGFFYISVARGATVQFDEIWVEKLGEP